MTFHEHIKWPGVGQTGYPLKNHGRHGDGSGGGANRTAIHSFRYWNRTTPDCQSYFNTNLGANDLKWYHHYSEDQYTYTAGIGNSTGAYTKYFTKTCWYVWRHLLECNGFKSDLHTLRRAETRSLAYILKQSCIATARKSKDSGLFRVWRAQIRPPRAWDGSSDTALAQHWRSTRSVSKLSHQFYGLYIWKVRLTHPSGKRMRVVRVPSNYCHALTPEYTPWPPRVGQFGPANSCPFMGLYDHYQSRRMTLPMKTVPWTVSQGTETEKGRYLF